MKQLVFDTTVSDDDRDNVGAYLRSSDGTLITHTTDGAREAVDVFTELGQTEDAAHTSGDIGAMALAVRSDAGGSLVDTDGDYAPLQVDSTGALRVNASVNVDSNSEKAEDSAHTTGDTGEYVLAVRQDTLATSTSADGDYASFKVNAAGELYAVDTAGNALLTTIDADTGTIAGDTTSIDATLTALSKAEDSAHTTGDQGIQTLAVRNDTLATLVDTDGDYAPLQVNADGALYVDAGTISVDDAALANTDFATTATSVTTTSTDIIGTALTDRKYLFIRNEGNRKMFIGKTTATTSGYPIAPGESLMLRAGAALDIRAITATGTADARMLELS